MAEEIKIKGTTKEDKYRSLYPQLRSLMDGEPDLIANMANVASALKETFDFFWVGFYRVSDHQLLLGPFQGPIACTRISYGKGVCGTAWKEGRTVLVADVDQFPGHIACSSLSRSEIVVPVKRSGKIIAVLDVDSEQLNTFDEVDARYLEQICDLFGNSRR